MSAPRRPGDSRAGGRPDRSDTRDDARPRRARPTSAAKPGKDEPVAKPARKARAEGWAKAKPPREKPGRASKFANKFKRGKQADRPTPMREDGPRRRDDETHPARADAPVRSAHPARADAPPRATRTGKPARAADARPGRPKAAPPAPASAVSRNDGARPTRPTRPPQPPQPPQPSQPSRAPAGKSASGKQPNRAARRAEARAEAAPVAATPAPAAAPAPAPDAPFLPGAGKREPQRIAKLLARAGVASRREIERMIEERRIAIDGVPLETPATLLTSLQGVTVDGKPVAAPTAARLFLFHKPVGVLTAERDFSGRPTIYDRLPEDLPRVVPVGRLDLNTEGLLLLTTDGELKRKLELPSTGLPRVYRARAYGDVTQQMLEDLSDGVTIEGIRYGPIDANLERRTGANVWIEMRITEGKNREVRRVLEYLGLQVSRLIRLAYGEFVLADLAPGGIVEVRQNDLVAFRQGLR